MLLTNSKQTHAEFARKSDYYSIVAKGPMLDRVYSMRYRSYSAENYIEENSAHKFIDEYDAKPNSTCFLAYCRQKLIGSIRACVFNAEEGNSIPILEVFENEIRDSIGLNNVIVEPNKFVVDPTFQRSGGVKARFVLLGAAVEHAIQKNATAIVVAVRPEHIKFYKMFGGTLASDAKLYPHLSFETVLMVCTDIHRCRDFIKRKIERVEIRNDSVLSHSGY